MKRQEKDNEELSNYEEWRSYPPVPELHIDHQNYKERSKDNGTANSDNSKCKS